MKRRVVVTGLGMLTAVGNDVATTWESLLAGKSGGGPITRFDIARFDVKFACELKGFDVSQYMERKEAKRSDLYTQYAVAASTQAMADAGLTEGSYDPERVGVIIGSGIGGLNTFEDQCETYFKSGPGRESRRSLSPCLSVISRPVLCPCIFSAKDPTTRCVSACATSAHAIGDATAHHPVR